MGFCYGYSETGRMVLACEVCGAAEGKTRKRNCPFGYCQADAVCVTCFAKPEVKAKVNKAAHVARGCEKSSARFKAQQAEKAALIAAGTPVRVSALGVGSEADGTYLVHVLFQKGTEVVGFFMRKEVYDAFPLIENATLAHYEAVNGAPLEPAPNDFHFGVPSKEVTQS